MKNAFRTLPALLVSGLALIATGAYAAPAPILSLTNQGITSSGTSAALYTPTGGVYEYTYNYNQIDYTQTVKLTSEVQIPATSTKPGLAYDFSTTTTAYTDYYSSYYKDSAYLSATGSDNIAGNKYLIISGTITSSVNTNISFSMGARGSFVATSAGFGQSSAPQLSSFYFATGSNPLTSVNPFTSVSGQSTYSDLASLSYSVVGGQSLALAAGVSQTFYAAVFAPSAVSISDFHLGINSDIFATIDTPHTPRSYDVKTLIGSHIIPVPEPETYAMLLAGLGLMGAIARRRKAKQA